MENFKKVISLSISNEVYKILKSKGNMSSYVNDLVLKENYKNISRNEIINELIEEKNIRDMYFKVEI